MATQYSKSWQINRATRVSSGVITATIDDNNITTNGASTITLPSATDLITGFSFTVTTTTNDVVTINPAPSDAINSLNSYSITTPGQVLFRVTEQGEWAASFTLASPYITGEIKLFAWWVLPSWRLLSDWSEISRTAFEDLFSTIGTTFGVWDGSTTFNIPDFRGRVPVGSGQLDWTGTTYNTWGTWGSESVQLTVAELPSHSHSVKAVSSTGNDTSPQNNVLANTAGLDREYSNTNPDILMSSNMIANTGGSQSHENRQPYTVVNYIIKT